MSQRILMLLAAVGGLTVLAMAFAAVYRLGGLPDAPTRADDGPAISGRAASPDGPAPTGNDASPDDAEPPENVMKFAAVGQLATGDHPAVAMFAAELDLVEEPGVVVGALVKDGPAARAGIRRGDIVLAVGGQAVDTIVDIHAALGDAAAGDSVTLRVRHGDAERDVALTLGEQAGHAFLGILPCGPGGMAHVVHRVGGDPAGGAFVASVATDGPAARAGLQEGDVITAVDGTAIGPDAELADLIAALEPGDTVTLSVDRKQEVRRDEDEPGRFEVEIKVEPVEVKAVLGAKPDDPGAAWLGVTYRSGGAFLWRHAGMPMPEVLPLPGAVRPPHDPGAGDVFMFRVAPGGAVPPGDGSMLREVAEPAEGVDPDVGSEDAGAWHAIPGVPAIPASKPNDA